VLRLGWKVRQIKKWIGVAFDELVSLMFRYARFLWCWWVSFKNVTSENNRQDFWSSSTIAASFQLKVQSQQVNVIKIDLGLHPLCERRIVKITHKKKDSQKKIFSHFISCISRCLIRSLNSAQTMGIKANTHDRWWLWEFTFCV
jgi:hypothetical protein